MSLKVLIVNKSFPAVALELLRKTVQATVVQCMDYDQNSMSEIKKNIKGCHGLIWNTKHRLTGEILDLAGPQLKVVSTMSSGTDHIDINEVKKRGLPLGNTPQVLDNAVADIAVGVMIAAARRFKEGIQEVESGEWKYGVQWKLGQDIAGSTVGVVGLGGVGQAIVRRLKGFEVAKFVYSGRSDKPEAKTLGVERVSLEQLLQESDYVILACPYTDETKHLINENTLKLMKKTSVIVNIARGDVIDQNALYDALKEQRIFAAGLDVVTPEPLPTDHKLLTLPNCFLHCKYLNFGEEGRTLAKDELLKLIPGCSALVWSSNLPITKDLLDAAGPNLTQVSTVSAGYNHCNPSELKSRGIKLTNTPGVLSPAVAEIAVALMLGAARRFTENLEQVKRGEWEIGFDKVLGQDLRDSTVGVIGLGGIGQAVVKRLAGFDVARFVYSGHRESPAGKALGAVFVDLDTLLTESDFVLLSAPLTDETRHMINSTTLAKMKKNAILVNVGRGDLIEQEALYNALKNKQIYAAGLDVTTPEPLPKDHKILTLPNLFVLPHIGSATVRTRREMGELAANNVVKGLSGQPLLTPVNL